MSFPMNPSETIILLADDDDGHVSLIERNLRRAGLTHPIERFSDGQQVLDFFFLCGAARSCRKGVAYVLLLDISMPKVDGIRVLEILKGDPLRRALPVYMLSTTDDQREVDRCHRLGCNSYIVKPVDYDQFSRTIQTLGAFIAQLQLPPLCVADLKD